MYPCSVQLKSCTALKALMYPVSFPYLPNAMSRQFPHPKLPFPLARGQNLVNFQQVVVKCILYGHKMAPSTFNHKNLLKNFKPFKV